MQLYKNMVKMAGGRVFSGFMTAFGGFKEARIILMYHRVLKSSSSLGCDPALFVTPSSLDMQISEISRFFEIVSLDKVLENKPGKRLCAITFDDGWRDNYDVAYPVLKKYSAPATIFIPPNMIGKAKQYWFDEISLLSSKATKNGIAGGFISYFRTFIHEWSPDKLDTATTCDLIAKMKNLPANELEGIVGEAYAKLSLKRSDERTTLSWDEIYEMGENGITFGPHGLNHYILPRINSETKSNEIYDSFRILKDKKVALSPFFSYPNGDWDVESLKLVKEAGYMGAVTTRLGTNTSSTDPFLMNRIGLHEDISCMSSLLWYRIFQAVSSVSHLQ